MNTRKLLLILFIPILFFSCGSQEKKVLGGWKSVGSHKDMKGFESMALKISENTIQLDVSLLKRSLSYTLKIIEIKSSSSGLEYTVEDENGVTFPVFFSKGKYREEDVYFLSADSDNPELFPMRKPVISN